MTGVNDALHDDGSSRNGENVERFEKCLSRRLITGLAEKES